MLIAFYVYLGCLVFGLVFAIVTGIFGGVFSTDAGGIDVDVDVDAPDVDPNVAVTADAVALSPLSPVIICFFIGVFGGVGMICLQMFETSIPLSVGISGSTAFVSAAALFWVMVRFMRWAQGSMSLSATSILGGTAQVNIPIPENGLGEITYEANGMRQRASAKSEDGGSVPQSAIVRVVKYSGTFYIVRPQENQPKE